LRLIKRLSRICFILSSLLALAASIYILAAPVNSITAQSSERGALVEETTRQVSWFAVQGWWGIFILVLFAAIYAGNAYFGVTQRWKLLAVGTPIVLILTYLAGFSIGTYYLPAAVALLLGCVISAVSHFPRWRKRQ